MEILKKNKELIIAFVLVLILIITGSYAWLTLSKQGKNVNTIKAGSLTLELDDVASSGIKLINEVPKSYQQGIQTQEYTFTLTNSGTITDSYTIYLDDVATYTDDSEQSHNIEEGEKIADDKIRYILIKDSEPKLASSSKLLSAASDRIIDSGTIAGSGTTYTYKLQIWIDSKADNDSVMGKKFNAKLRVEAEQAHS